MIWTDVNYWSVKSKKTYYKSDALDSETYYTYDEDDNMISMLDKKGGNVIRHTVSSYYSKKRIISYAESDTEMNGNDDSMTFKLEYRTLNNSTIFCLKF